MGRRRLRKRANGEGTIYQRSDGRWAAEVVDTTKAAGSAWHETELLFTTGIGAMLDARNMLRQSIGTMPDVFVGMGSLQDRCEATRDFLELQPAIERDRLGC